MIIEFRVKNFHSIKDEQILSFEASPDKEYEDYYVVNIGKYRLLKMAMIYGANAAGKSNVLMALDVLRLLAVDRRDNDAKIPTVPFQFSDETKNENTELALEFLVKVDNQYLRHRYFIEFNTNEIVKEKLEYYPSTQPALIFLRILNRVNPRGFDLTIGNKIKLKSNDIEAIELNTLMTTSILSCFKVINSLFLEARRGFEWFNTKLLPVVNNSMDAVVDTLTSRYFYDFPEQKDLLVQLLQKADMSVQDIKHEIEEGTLANIPVNIKYYKDRIKREVIHQYNSDKTCSLPYILESLGTKKLLMLSGPLFWAILREMSLPIDELESSLHFELQKYFILVFLANSKHSQLLFTTHNIMLLDWDAIRNDVVWFTEKREDGSTELYSLLEFKGVNRRKVLNQYMAGNFGAKPDIYDYHLDFDSIRDMDDGKKEE
ncbi:MAG: ATP-binding protein [Candidatus Cloacimonetes bacterium]|nr:ATP-binding protein [Candidatus Cloacimonadota bacterium]